MEWDDAFFDAFFFTEKVFRFILENTEQNVRRMQNVSFMGKNDEK